MPEPKTLPELLRIMDVATALRREREAATAQLSAADTRAQLRERLRATAIASGEQVTTAEIDAAIHHYYDTLHRFSEPPRSLKWVLAHLYVRRVRIAVGTAVITVIAALSWIAIRSAASSFSPQVRQERAEARQLEQRTKLLANARAVHGAIHGLALEEDARQEADRLLKVVEALAAGVDSKDVDTAIARLFALRAGLEEAYELRVVSRPGERSGIEGTFGNRVTGYYLILEAVTADGRVLRRAIRDAELGRVVEVNKWGEQVPKSVYDRIAADKRQDGVVDEALFGRKVRGMRDEEVVMVDEAQAQPVRRGRQITKDL